MFFYVKLQIEFGLVVIFFCLGVRFNFLNLAFLQNKHTLSLESSVTSSNLINKKKLKNLQILVCEVVKLGFHYNGTQRQCVVNWETAEIQNHWQCEHKAFFRRVESHFQFLPLVHLQVFYMPAKFFSLQRKQRNTENMKSPTQSFYRILSLFSGPFYYLS